MVNKIAISGKANSGKNTVAQTLIFLAALKKIESKVFAFADPIKDMFLHMFPNTDPDFLWGESAKRNTKIPGLEVTIREVLTDMGRLGRSYYSKVWIEATLHKVTTYLEQRPQDLAIISDVRFQNELQTLTDSDFFVIKIVRPDSEVTANPTDVSEIDLDLVPDKAYNYILHNDGDQNELVVKTVELAKKLNLS